MKLIAVLLGCSVAFLSSMAAPVFSQERNDLSKPDKKWKTSFALTALSVGSDNSDSQGLGESAWGVELAGNYYFSPQLVTSLGFGVVNIKDNENFSQQVSNQFSSNVQSAESSVISIPFFAEVSYRSLAMNDNGYGYGVGAGLTQFFATEREIGNCVDCRSDDISFDGGVYLTASAYYNRTNSSKFGLSARQYVSGDVKTGFLFWFEMN